MPIEIQTSAGTGPRHTHYVSLHNNTIHPALTSPAGFEDANPKDWRAATHAEIQQYLGGHDSLEVRPLPLTGIPGGSEALLNPRSLKLAEDDPEPVDQAPVYPAVAAMPQDVPEAPVLPPVAPPAPVSPVLPASLADPDLSNNIPPPPPGA
jgi:hypothetical protein